LVIASAVTVIKHGSAIVLKVAVYYGCCSLFLWSAFGLCYYICL